MYNVVDVDGHVLSLQEPTISHDLGPPRKHI